MLTVSSEKSKIKVAKVEERRQMLSNPLPEEFIKGLHIIEELEAAGFEAYFVGGSVRDYLLNRPIHDVDIATSAYPEEVKQVFSQTIDVGIEHGTVLVISDYGQYEVTTFRTESTYQDFRRPDEVTFVRSLAEDLKRRDFTINALAMTKTGAIIDYFDGQIDLENKQLRAVGEPTERFYEDALRMLRGVRFASQLGFEIEAKTFEAIKQHHPLLAHVSIERTHIEWIKMMMGDYRNKGLVSFLDSDLSEMCPGFTNQKQRLISLLTLEAVPIESELAVWGLVVDALELKGRSRLNFIKSWKLSNQLKLQIINVTDALTFLKTSDWDTMTLYGLSPFEVATVEHIRYLKTGVDCSRDTLKRHGNLPIHSKADLAINGRDILNYLHKEPGKWLGETLNELEEAVLCGKVANDKVALMTYIEKEKRN